MAWAPCRRCGELRKVDNVYTPDGFTSPPCVHCGDPGYVTPYDEDAPASP